MTELYQTRVDSAGINAAKKIDKSPGTCYNTDNVTQCGGVALRRVFRQLLPWLIVGAFIVVFSFVVGCPLRRLFGISCLFCGMSRACLQAARLHFAAAFRFHPLWPLLPPALALGIWATYRRPKALKPLGLAMLALLLAVYAFRLWKHDPVVWPDLSAGLLTGLFQ